VPTVAQFTVTAAKAALKQNGLKAATHMITQSSTSIPQGEVIGTQPGAGQNLANGSSVTLIVSSGESVPNVVNDSYGDAQAALSNFTNAGTQVVPKYQTTTTAQPDTVISQSPPAGQPLPKGGSIVLTVAKAPTTQKVPRVVGEPPTVAANQLGGLGLNVSEIPKTTRNPAMVGLIVKQFPTSLTVVKKGTIITIYYGVAPTGTTGGGNTGGGVSTGPQTTNTTTTPSSTTTTTSVTTT
jgi:serine/threonine-protein kinase